MNTAKHTQTLIKTGVIFALYLLISIPLYRHFHEKLYQNMVWNVFLAVLPLLFAVWLDACDSRWGWFRKGILGIAWLLFFPNAPYMITDIIHISGNTFFLNQQEYNQLSYSTNMTVWIRIVYLGLGILIGVLAGMQSLRLVHRLLDRRLGTIFSHLAVWAFCLLSGYGIYLGRFLRLNSWNFIHLRRIFDKISGADPLFAAKFTLLYAFFIYASYLIFCTFYPKHDTSR